MNSSGQLITDPVCLRYFTTVFVPSFPVEKVGIRTHRELQTLAMCLDSLGKGDLAQTADMLMQRMKAVELASREGWTLATQLELLPRTASGLTSLSEHRKAARAQLLQHKLEEAKLKLSKK